MVGLCLKITLYIIKHTKIRLSSEFASSAFNSSIDIRGIFKLERSITSSDIVTAFSTRDLSLRFVNSSWFLIKSTFIIPISF